MGAETPSRFGKYRLERLLGEGGMAKVYRAVSENTGQRVALKILTPPGHLDAAKRNEMVARFQREALAASALSHPHIAQVYEVGKVGEQHYIAMELLEGHTLRKEIDLGGAMPPQRALHLLEQIGSALQAVHELGIVHRDVKPQNVMLLPDGKAKLMDFGVARLQSEGFLTSTGEVIGSPDYMSPEQARGEPADARADVFSLGAVLYEMLTGRKCFTGSTVAEVVGQILHQEPAPLPASLRQFAPVLRRALAKAPGARYGSVADLLTAARLGASGAIAQPAAEAGVPAAEQARPAAVRRRAPAPEGMRAEGWVIGLAGLVLLLFGMSTLRWQLAALAGFTGILTATVFHRPWYGLVVVLLSVACGLGAVVLGSGR